MAIVRNTNTQMTDTGTANGKPRNIPSNNKYTKLRHTVNGTHAHEVMNKSYNGNAPVLNPNSPLYKTSIADYNAQLAKAKAEQEQKDAAGNRTYYNLYRSYASSRGGSGGGAAGTADVAGTGDNLAALAAALQAQKQARIDAINAANAALDKQAEAMRGRYDASLATIGQDYQKLRNQAEVNRYRAMFNQREALANRGALDSGAGRQETMAMNNNYNNNLNTISLQEAAERAAVQNAINEMYASVENQKAQNMTNGLSDYSSALQNLINAQYSGYTPEGSAYYQQALQALGANNGANDSNYTAYLRALGYNV